MVEMFSLLTQTGRYRLYGTFTLALSKTLIRNFENRQDRQWRPGCSNQRENPTTTCIAVLYYLIDYKE
jgi:hypothetical protein